MKRILYVEDEPSFQALVQIMLEREDFLVDVADNGAEGVRQAEAVPYDLILMDLNMPVLDGFEATRALKATQAYRAVPIVAVTGLTSPALIDKAYGAGICDYIAKPFKRNQLVDLVYKHLALATCEE
ncbi:CAI-1 autoinducer sensor kinase/phosphatase CqsS [compost metagenome]